MKRGSRGSSCDKVGLLGHGAYLAVGPWGANARVVLEYDVTGPNLRALAELPVWHMSCNCHTDVVALPGCAVAAVC